jgi:hypothetical protein
MQSQLSIVESRGSERFGFATCRQHLKAYAFSSVPIPTRSGKILIHLSYYTISDYCHDKNSGICQSGTPG